MLELYTTMSLNQKVSTISSFVETLDTKMQMSVISMMVSNIVISDRAMLYQEVLGGLLPKERVSRLMSEYY